MSRENFRREISREFDAISGSPSPALSARVRSALAQENQSRTGPFWVAGLAAALIAAIVIGVFVVANFNRHQTGLVPGGLPTPTPATSAPAFRCDSGTGLVFIPTSNAAPQVAYIDMVRTGTHTGYDRITIEFNNGAPTKADVTPQSTARFTQGASGQPVTLAGSAGILVTINGADEHTAYGGPTDLKPGYPVLLEARQVQDFEGTVQWGLGLSKSACYRTLFLANPVRLVIDIQTG